MEDDEKEETSPPKSHSFTPPPLCFSDYTMEDADKIRERLFAAIDYHQEHPESCIEQTLAFWQKINYGFYVVEGIREACLHPKSKRE